MQDLKRAMPGTVFGPDMDRMIFVWPIVAAAAISLVSELLDSDAMPHWIYATSVVIFDVGHVGTTLLLVHSAYSSRPNSLFWQLPVVLFAFLLLSCFWSLPFTWVLLGYVTMVHYMQQQLRLLTLCDGTATHRFFAIVGALFPVIIWHTDQDRGFDWFFRDDPLPFVLPEVMYPIALTLWILCGLVFVAKCVVSEDGMLCMKNVTVACGWVSWGVGVLHPSFRVSMLFLTIPHALPCYTVSYYVLKNKWEASPPRTDAARFSAMLAGSPVLYLLFFMVLAAVEEFLWEALIYREWSTHIFPHHESSALTHALFTAVLMVPQVSHIAFDFLIWNEAYHPRVRVLVAAPRDCFDSYL